MACGEVSVVRCLGLEAVWQATGVEIAYRARMTPVMPTVNLDTGDAAELAELLQFLHDWLAADADQLGESLSGFVGSRTYDTAQLRVDLSRFTFLLGSSDGEALFGHELE
jgi:hypothetical protein